MSPIKVGNCNLEFQSPERIFPSASSIRHEFQSPEQRPAINMINKFQSSSLKRTWDEDTQNALSSDNKRLRCDKSTTRRNLITRVLEIYKEHLYFHGTGIDSARNIIKHGMVLAKKKSLGNTKLLNQSYGLDDPEARRHHYMQKTDREAAEYAKAFECPTILCLILPPSDFSLEIDPVGDSRTAFRTSKDIKRKYILPSDPSQLHGEQLNKLNKKLGIREKLSEFELRDLVDTVREKILIDRRHVIESAKSYLDQEKERDSLTKHALKKRGIDFSELKEGETFSINLFEASCFMQTP